MNATNLTSYMYGLISGGTLVGGIVGGFFTQWRGDISGVLCFVGGILCLVGLLIHTIEADD